jgi:hypothetical protein
MKTDDLVTELAAMFPAAARCFHGHPIQGTEREKRNDGDERDLSFPGIR